MTVDTDTPEVKENINGVLSLLKANHPADCMTCEVRCGCRAGAGGSAAGGGGHCQREAHACAVPRHAHGAHTVPRHARRGAHS